MTIGKMIKLACGVAAAIAGAAMASGGIKDTIDVFKKEPEDGVAPEIPEADGAAADDPLTEEEPTEEDGVDGGES